MKEKYFPISRKLLRQKVEEFVGQPNREISRRRRKNELSKFDKIVTRLKTNAAVVTRRTNPEKYEYLKNFLTSWRFSSAWTKSIIETCKKTDTKDTSA